MAYIRLCVSLIIIAFLVCTPLLSFSARADAPFNDPFQRTWERVDKPVSDVQATRTWLWGPEAFTTGLLENYAEAANGQRVVQYYDKSRMEITSDPAIPQDIVWYVTNGLLARELISGLMQTGDSAFEPIGAAQLNVAGDGDDPTGPTYATFVSVTGRALARNGAVTMDTNDVSAAGCVPVDELPNPTVEISTATPTQEISTAAPTPETPTPVTQTPTPVTQTPTPETPTPVTQTPTPVTQTPTPETPVSSTPTPETPVVSTPTPTPETPVSTTTPVGQTPTPATPTVPATLTRVPSTPTSVTQTPTSWATSTPTATGTVVRIVTFPKTGSGGMLTVQQDEPVAVMNLALSIAMVMLLTGGLGTAVERRSRR